MASDVLINNNQVNMIILKVILKRLALMVTNVQTRQHKLIYALAMHLIEVLNKFDIHYFKYLNLVFTF